MKRLKILILVFCAALAVPLGYFVFRTHLGLQQEEVAELRFFAETLFEEMERELAALVIVEEGRAIDDYNYLLNPTPDQDRNRNRSGPYHEEYILGYLQSNPDGSYRTSLAAVGRAKPEERAQVLAQLKETNRALQTQKTRTTVSTKSAPVKENKKKTKKASPSLAEKYLDLSRGKKDKDYLGQEEKRVEQISALQYRNIAPPPPVLTKKEAELQTGDAVEYGEAQAAGETAAMNESDATGADSRLKLDSALQNLTFQVEVDPLQAMAIDGERFFIFRRIVIDNQVYRQGFVIGVSEFLKHLVETHFIGQPMSRFTRLSLRVLDQGRELNSIQAGPVADKPVLSIQHGFPRPFAFLQGLLVCRNIPRSDGRNTLFIMIVTLTAVILLGLLAIYHNVRVVVDLSERRTGFVSSVTHELKTPLTNIRLYIEMLEQGIARDQEREQEYFRILTGESARLSRLINNVLEFSKLEKKQRQMDLVEGLFDEVIEETLGVMKEKLRQEGFTVEVDSRVENPFSYDREVMVQALMNLMENSIKFGRNGPEKKIILRVAPQGGRMAVSVSDTGPGVPKKALRRIFDDFYRVEGPLTRSAKGTGIGLALVKKYVQAMGGTVTAANNHGPGCTITILLPL